MTAIRRETGFLADSIPGFDETVFEDVIPGFDEAGFFADVIPGFDETGFFRRHIGIYHRWKEGS